MNKKAARLQVDNLACIRQQRRLFTDISFQLYDGELLLIEGENGSGKSSLLRLLTGLSTKAAGEILWCGKNISAEYKHEIHYIGHENGIKPGLTVVENLQLSQHLSSSTALPLQDILEALQLSSHKNSFAKNLSAGQKRRVALARLFLMQRKLWILDEPLTALDAVTQTFFLSRLEMHLQQGGIAIVSSHHSITLNNILVKQLRLESC